MDYDIAAFILSKWYTCVQPIDLPPRLDSAPAALECYQVTGLDDLLYSVLATELAGERIEPNPTAVIRTVGQYDRGVCA